MMKFIYQYDENSTEVVFTVPGPDTTLPEALEQFELFLKACGYSFDGELDFIEQVEASNE